jgi:hypothetical protein
MSPQEHEQLAALLQQLAQTRAEAKDAEAAAMIDHALARQPDTAYLLAQRTLMLDTALRAVQAEIAHFKALLEEVLAARSVTLHRADSWGDAEAANTAPGRAANAAAFTPPPGR